MSDILNQINKERYIQEKKSFQEFVELSPRLENPPSTNRGGNPPLPLSNEQEKRVKIDWLSITSTAGYQNIKEVAFCLFPTLEIIFNDFGMMSYPKSDSLILDGVQIGILCYGADHGRDLLSISGKGCSKWDTRSYSFILECMQTIDARIVRIDHALDFYKAELTFEDCETAFYNNEFKLKEGGRNPTKQKIESEINNKNLGRTLYVGSRKSSKLCRCYEKGLEIFAKMPDKFRESCTEPENLIYGSEQNAPNGTIANQWLRVEVEHKNKDRDLPLEMINQTEEYFSGSYPFCSRILNLTEGKRPKSLKPTSEIDLEKMILNCRNAYGNLIYSLTELGFTSDEIIQRLSTGLHNERLLKSGIISLVKNDSNWINSMKNSYIPF